MLLRWPVFFALCLGALIVSSVGVAEASPRQVERALELYQAGQLTRALSAFERALASGDNVDADMPTIYRHLGELRAGAGDAAGAEDAFKKLFALDPSVVPSPEWSPVVLEPFERARAAVVHGTSGSQQGTQNGGGTRQGTQNGGGTQDGGGTGHEQPPPPVTPATPASFGSLGPALDSTVWSSPGESRDGSGIFGSAWFWGGVAAFVAAAVAVGIVTTSSSGEPYLAVDGGR